MKKLILILAVVLPFMSNAQDYRVIDWKTNVLNVQTIAIDTFVFDAEPTDYNDAGAITREIGNYFIDYVARCFKIINSDANTITVVDLEHINLAPQSNKIGRVYQSIVDADSIFKSIGGVDISVLDDLSRWKDVARNNELFGRKIKELDGRDTTGIYHINRQLLDSISPDDTTNWNKYLIETDTANIPDKEKYFWSAEKKWLPITSSVANGASAPLYFTNINSEISGYKKMSYTNDVAISTFSATTSKDTVLVEEFLYDSGLGTSIIDAGVWSIRTFCKVSGAAAVSKIMYEVFVRDDADSTLFSFYSDEINNTDFQYNDYSFVGNAINLQKTTYRLGIKVYFLTTSAAAITLDFRVGDGETTYANVPLALRHDQLRDKNGNPAYLHVTFQDTALINQLRRDSANFVTYTGNDRDLDMGANSINTDTVKIDGVPLLLNTFKQGNLGGASNIFYSTGASSQPASGSINQVMGGNALTANYVPKWDGNKFANSGMIEVGGKFGIGTVDPSAKLNIKSYIGENWIYLQTEGGNPIIESQAGLVIRSANTNQVFSRENGIALGNVDMNITGYGVLNTVENKVGINTYTPSERLDVNGNAIADVLKSRVPTGTPPLVVASTTKVDSLNVGFLDGKKASDFQLKSDTSTFDATISDLNDSTAAIRSLANTKATISGTDNYIMKKTGANTLGNSSISDNGSLVSSTLPIKGSLLYSGTSEYANGYIKLGKGGAGNRFAVIDLIGDDFYSDFGLRIVRGNSGENAVSEIQTRGKGGFIFKTIDAGSLYFATKNTTALTIDTLQNAGFGTTTPAARIHSQSTGTQAILGYDATNYTYLSTGSTGNLTIDPTGDTTKIVGAINSTGGFFKNGVEITGGTGSMVYPINSGIVQFNGTTWGTSITNNSSLWNNAYDKKIVSAAFSGTSTKTLTLYQQDGNVLQAAFTDESGGTTNWSTDTYGLYYTAGKVGVGANSDVNTWLNVGSLTSTNIGVYGKSQTNPGVRGSSVDYTGVFGSSTDQYGVYGVSANGYGGGFDKGINLPSGNLDIQGQTRISQGGFFQPVSSSDASAPNNSIYYSTTQSKLVYKNASGTINVLY